jgi:hypothetical protein
VLLPFAPWQAWQVAALVAPASTLGAGMARVVKIVLEMVAAKIQNRFMTP